LKKTKRLLELLLFVQVATVVAVFLDIPVLRQCFGFIYLSFVPGALILVIFKTKIQGKVTFTLISIGLSLAFTMFVGLFINEIYPFFGTSQPLSTLPVMVTIAATLFELSFVGYVRTNKSDIGEPTQSNNEDSFFRQVTLRQILGVSLLFCAPLLTLVGATVHSTPILLTSVVFIAVLVFASFFSSILSPRLRPVVVIVVALSVLFIVPFLSQHLIGFDINEEFYVFRATQINSLWNPSFTSPINQVIDYNGMLSVTILPTVYSNLLNISGEWVFRLIYLLFYSLVPLTLYEMYRQPFGKSIAFLAAFYFILFPRFYLEERRQIIGELFLVLLLLIILNPKLSVRKKQVFSLVFGAALVVSHYSIFYIFVYCVLFGWILISLLNKTRIVKLESELKRVFVPAIFLTLMLVGFLWYIFVTPNLGTDLFRYASGILNSFTGDFTSLQSRGGTVSDFVAPSLATNFVTQLDTTINKIPYILVGIGFIALIKKYKKMSLSPEFLGMASASLVLLAAVLVVPSLAPDFLPDRFYHVCLIFLAPVCVLGGVTLFELVMKPIKRIKRKHSTAIGIVCIFLIVIFFFKVGFFAELTSSPPYSTTLSFSRMANSSNPQTLASLYNAYSPPEDVQSAIWLAQFAYNSSNVYADAISASHVLPAYAHTVIDYNHILTVNTTIAPGSYVYLRYFNVKGYFANSNGEILNMSQFSNQLENADKIYSNGESEIYFSNSSK
jgi:uncharacterized membrane protein